MAIEIKPLSAKHLNAFLGLRLEALRTSPMSYRSSVEEESQQGKERYHTTLSVNDNTNLICGAFDTDQLVGIGGVYREKRAKSKHKFVIWGLYVTAGYRKKGVRKHLMEYILLHVKNSNTECLHFMLSVEATKYHCNESLSIVRL